MAMESQQQAPKAWRRRSFCSTLGLFLLVLVLGAVNTPALADQIYDSPTDQIYDSPSDQIYNSTSPGPADQIYNSSSSPPSQLVFYDTEYGPAPDQTTVIAVSPSGNKAALEFGTIAVITNFLREADAESSPVVGSVKGQAIVAKDFTLDTSLTFVLKTGSYSGTITALGVADALGGGELAVVGGTGDFRWARGYLVTKATTPATDVTKHEFRFYIKYD